MTMEPNPTSDHILDWIEGSVSFFPSFLDNPYDSSDIHDYQLWDQGQDISLYQTDANTDSSKAINNNNNNNTIAAAAAASTTSTTPLEPYDSNTPTLSDLPKKRNAADEPSLKPSQNHKHKRIKSRPMNEADNGDAVVEGTTVRKSGGNKKGASKANGNNCNNGNNKEGRWAEQLLNPCAIAITGGNLNRVQHLLYVLHELASPTGDANHRLAAHGLRALTHHLSSTPSSTSSGPITFASTEPRFFQKSLLKFYEVSPWFSFPNNIANASILQVLSEEPDNSRTLHILDIGVSHGVQWPTFLEALSRRPGGPPPLVRLTVVTASSSTENDHNMETPFSIGPPGDNFSSRLLGFAQSMNVNLQINRLENHPLETLNSQSIGTSPDETFIVCAQFRLHHLNHNTPDERSEFLKVLRNIEPKGVILSENNMECCCSSCGNFATGFSRRVEYLWRFLDSTSSAFKGRESDERRVMEGEAAKALTNQREMNEGKEKWCERMKEAGFVGEIFGEDAIDGGRALLRKYDNNWEMKVEENNSSVGLWWKGQPVSFCSLWKLDGNDQGKTSSTLTSKL
ncbi:protein NODULATION SIGNALING PATHWAY 1 [Gastrolobium bilobum]|uniref:protein NODULATION SIGNALING PATHWAY 1 n=1 Tax=Gastrolobium bilobum TaxID=150636 RepID=UPI002AAF3C5B|nr:protein NODULATION SIGNALING PATHWAY 1 [Gastrolobium bilobum]